MPKINIDGFEILDVSNSVMPTEETGKSQKRESRRLLWMQILVPVLLGCLLLMQTTWARRTTSITFDETYYLNCSIQSIHDGWLDPRLSNSGVGAVPTTIWGLPVAAAYPKSERPDEWEGSTEDPEINAWSRWWNSVLIGLPLMGSVYVWLYRRRGLIAASVGGLLMTFSPSILAHSALATTDASFALFGMLAVAGIVEYLRAPDWFRFLGLGVLLGLALGAKYSSVFLFPVVGVLLLLKLWPCVLGPWWKRASIVIALATCKLVLLVGISGVVLWGTDWFSFTGPLKLVSLEDTPPDSPWIQFLGNGPTARWIMDASHRNLYRPSVFGSLVSRYLHERGGHNAFLMGQHSKLGWRYYFLFAWVFKSTLPELALSLAIIPLCTAGMWSKSNVSPDDRSAQVVWLVAMCFFSAMLCSAHVNIGQRYMLILYPLTFLAAVDLLWQIFASRNWIRIAIGAILVVGQIASSLAVAPHYLAYFSPIIGGPSQGRFYLADSNIDWGQDLPRLRDEIRRLGYHRPILSYFGTAKPSAYGVDATTFLESTYAQLDEFDVLALSINKWNGVYITPKDVFAEFRTRKFVASAGYSILLFDLSEIGARDALREAWRRYPRELVEK